MVAASLTEARLRWGTPDCGRHGKKGVSGVVSTVEGDAFHVRTYRRVRRERGGALSGILKHRVTAGLLFAAFDTSLPM
ncbi:hypothetical protein NDU88_002258 [Pleurodeles waltl]|uniref:Uncharacterized protein n=1 Tax=Pleurodeles waltl TaxID=8319 RepID=A0AAV7P8G7_PLEWA|nr:hypothetical protein NDU88_002258 [Pleurodeles waltl]